MLKNSYQQYGDPVKVGWTIGHAPLWLRGIRLAEGEGGAAPAAAQQPAGSENQQPAPSPATVAAFIAAQKAAEGGTPAPAAPTAAAPAPVQQLQGFTPEQMQKAMADAEAAQKAAKEAQAALEAAQKERDDYQAQLTQFAREKAVTAAAGDKCNRVQ